MKKILIITCVLAASLSSFGQKKKGKYETIIGHDDQGNLMADSQLVLSPGQKPPKGVKKYIYRNKKGDQVNSTGNYMIIYREDENGEMFLDSVKVK
ncbi:MAG: hypothetical protein RIE58_01440 [Vicingaceae bacterium]